MKFRHRKDFEGNTRSGHVFILATKKRRELRLYVFWRDRNPYIPLPFEIQYRSEPVPFWMPTIIPKRKKKI